MSFLTCSIEYRSFGSLMWLITGKWRWCSFLVLVIRFRQIQQPVSHKHNLELFNDTRHGWMTMTTTSRSSFVSVIITNKLPSQSACVETSFEALSVGWYWRFSVVSPVKHWPMSSDSQWQPVSWSGTAQVRRCASSKAHSRSNIVF